MSVTLAQARGRLRLWLEDPAAGGLWADDELDEALGQALAAYSLDAPAEAATTLTAADGDVALSLPADTAPSGAVVRVVSPSGMVIPRRGVPQRWTADEELAWERWGEQLVFSRPLAAGEYVVWHYGARLLPAGDADPLPLPATDVPLLLAGAVVWCVGERMRQEWKRGPLPVRYTEIRDAARQDYAQLLGAMRRRLTVRRLESSQ